MKRFFAVLAVSLLAGVCVSVSASGPAARGGGHSITTTVNTDRLEDCGDIRVTSSTGDVATAEERLAIPFSEAQSLRADPGKNGGFYVRAWDRDEYSVYACKAAVQSSERRARELLDRIRIVRSAGSLTADGPSGDDWVVYFLIWAPRKASLDFQTHNGGISLDGIAGRARLRTQNGPISVKRCSGEVQAYTENGPIDFSGSAGNLDMRTQNGPINVRLTADRWDGRGLEAHTQNGPLHLDLPNSFQSGLQVRSSWHSPWNCSGLACRQSRKDWDDHNRMMEIGGPSAVVRVSTVNGPVSIQSKRL